MNTATNRGTQRSVLATLRSLVPPRTLSYSESLRIAELQANHLLALHAVDSTTPGELITDLPRLKVLREQGLPVSGAAHWNGNHWIITLNADEPEARQRFSLAHEFKHILDHTSTDRQYEAREGFSSEQQAERVADYFAACLLMPKRLTKRLWGEGPRDIARLARKLGVSQPALRYRLTYLGLIEQGERCTPVGRAGATPRPGVRLSSLGTA